MISTSHLHPMLVHFPIALITIGFMADIAFLVFKKEVCLSKTGFYLMIIGTLSAIAAFMSGNLFTYEPTQGEIVKVFSSHQTAALITVIIMSIGSTLRIYMTIAKKEQTLLKWIVFMFYFAGTASVGYTGYMGGTMVYNYMMSL